jgi:hypothetical protein
MGQGMGGEVKRIVINSTSERSKVISERFNALWQP